MGYYAAGGYYQAGGFSFKKLGRWVNKQVHNPIISGLIGMIPGGSTAMGALALVNGSSNAASIPAALTTGSAAPPAQNAEPAQNGRRGRARRRSRRSRW
jgi:hypothetical protein